MHYQTTNGQEYDLSRFTSTESLLFTWLMLEYDESKSPKDFIEKTALSVLEVVNNYGPKVKEHPLYEIYLDLMIRPKEIKGLSEDFLEEKVL